MFPLYDTIPHRRVPWITLLIIAINIFMVVWMQRFSPAEYGRFIVRHGFIPQRMAQLSDPNLVVKVDIAQMQDNPLQQLPVKPNVVRLQPRASQIYASMFTMMFLHAGWLHLVLNMWFLWIFGNNVEDRLGHFVYLCFYLIGGVFALMLHWAIAPDSTLPVVGASGAVAAVLGAYAITYPMAKVRTLVLFLLVVDIPALIFLGLWFMFQLAGGLAVLGDPAQGGVAWWAHIGGFAAGLMLMPVLSLGSSPPDQNWSKELEHGFGPGTYRESR